MPRLRRRSAFAIGLLAGAFAMLTLVACGARTSGRAVTTVKTPTTVPSASRTTRGTAGVAAEATDALALELLPRIGAPSANAVFSPYSIQAALSMVGAGAAGETARQIAHVLRTGDLAALAAGDAALAGRLAAATAPPRGAPARGVARLQIANGLFTQAGLGLRTAFVQTLRGAFGAAPQRVDFHSAPETARRAINAWVAGRTGKLITDLMPAGSITTQTALVLANAIYLRAHWADPFVAGQTAPGPFFTSAGTRVTAQYMTQPPLQLLYGTGPGYQAMALAYLDSTLSMLVLLPRASTFASYQRTLTVPALTRLQRTLSPRLVALQMPRFHLLGAQSLNDLLAALGMPLAFTDAADFSGITGQARLKIAQVEHAADLNVDEAGTVASAATGIAIAPTAIAAPNQALRLKLDHPFLLFLRDDATGTILFAARVVDP
ncbi:MAG: serpin family protein [Solirubrobacteraceae bacterium]|jgi:serpin B